MAKARVSKPDFPSNKKGPALQYPAPIIPMPGIWTLGFEIKNLTDDLIEDAIESQFDITNSMGAIAAGLKQELDAALKSPVWAWTSGNRDIYDTGELMDSGKVVAMGDRLSVSYSAPYAMLIHNGGYIHPYGNLKARPIYLPGRPWVSSVLYGGGPVPKFDPTKYID